MTTPPPYVGRFAPSPTGPLHAGSLVAALASWLDARAHHGQWRVRIEDLDPPRCPSGAGELILRQLSACGLVPDGQVLWQSQRGALYQTALAQLLGAGLAYPCACSRQDIEQALASRGQTRLRHAELIYPGTCRGGLQGKVARAWRLDTGRAMAGLGQGDNQARLTWRDRRLGPQSQDIASQVGDFILKRADGLWAYQLAVVVDDAAQGITHVVRGQDLTDNTARQILLQKALGLATPQYLHTPLVLGADGNKLSKQNGALALNLRDPLAALNAAAAVLGLSPQRVTPSQALAQWVGQWQAHLQSATLSSPP